MRLIATDGVFSMDGDVAPLKDICDLAEKYACLRFADSHGSSCLVVAGMMRACSLMSAMPRASLGPLVEALMSISMCAAVFM